MARNRRDIGREAFERTQQRGYQFCWFDLAWLRQWWECSPRRKPRRGKGKTRFWKLDKFNYARRQWEHVTIEAATKSEARSIFKASYPGAKFPAVREMKAA